MGPTGAVHTSPFYKSRQGRPGLLQSRAWCWGLPPAPRLTFRGVPGTMCAFVYVLPVYGPLPALGMSGQTQCGHWGPCEHAFCP